MRTIQKVAILGATGPLGQVLVPALKNAGFQVTCITRPGSKSIPPAETEVKTADYSSLPSLTDALQGQDALIEAFNPSASAAQSIIVQAALAADVAHLITPDFSCDTFNPNIGELRVFEPKIQAQKELERLVATSDGKLAWTAVIIGPWYDWATNTGQFWINKKERTITRFGSGNQKYSMSRYELTGDATVAVLKNPTQFRNRPAYFASHTISTNHLIAVVNELGLEGWKVVDVSIEDYLTKGTELWDQDTQKGVTLRMRTPAYTMLSTVSLVDENNRYGADFSDKAEPGWDEGEEALKANLKKLLTQ
ncbi:hypothetical protein F5884DRAFT_876375 [Xylogone sp. PMI_703]|nr:hypothetical protein F5884DRAFT_876375 [Xylogone sp. PMI_703]